MPIIEPMWEERVRMGPPPSAPQAHGHGATGTVVRLAGWRRTQVARSLVALLCVAGGVVVGGGLWLLSMLFSMWGSGPGATERVIVFACIAGGIVLGGAVVWPVLGSDGPHLVLGDQHLRFHHPDLVADMLIDRSAIVAIHADHAAAVPLAVAREMGLSTFDGSNLAMVFRTPQHIPRARVVAQLNPFFDMRVGRAMGGLRLRVEDVDWARRVFGTMPQYRALTDDDYAQAAIQRRQLTPQQAVAVAAIAAVGLAMLVVDHLL